MDEQEINVSWTFRFGDSAVSVDLLTLMVADDTRCALVGTTDLVTYRTIANRGYFEDSPANRLGVTEAEFSSERPLYLRLGLTEKGWTAVTEQRATAHLIERFRSPSPDDPLSEGSSWRLEEAWQELRMDESIGGGLIRVGYRTVWSEPTGEVDRLRRRGPVSAAVVEALIENGLPVRYRPKSDDYEVELTVGPEAYPAHLEPLDAESGLRITVELGEIAPGSPASDVAQAVSAVNERLLQGGFAADGGRVSFVSHIEANPDFVGAPFVFQALRAAISVAHQFRGEILQEL